MGGEGGASDGAAAQEGASRKWQKQGLSVHGAAAAAEAGSNGDEESGSILAPFAFNFSMRCDASALQTAGREALQAALQAAIGVVVTKFGGHDFRLELPRVGPSDHTLQGVLPLVLERVGPEGGARCFLVCKSWRRELEARGFCYRTYQLCSTLASANSAEVLVWNNREETVFDSGVPLIFERLAQKFLRRMEASTGQAEVALCADVIAFLKYSSGWKGSLHQWLQFASQEPHQSFLSRGATATANILTLPLVQWTFNPHWRCTEWRTLPGHSDRVNSTSFSSDGVLVVSGSHDTLLKIWDVETGAEVSNNAGVVCEKRGVLGHFVRIPWILICGVEVV